MPPAEGRPRCSGTNTGAASRRPETLCPALRHALYHGKNGAVAHVELITRMQRRHSIPLQLILDTIGTIYHKRSIRGAQVLDEPAVLFAAPDANMML